MDTDAGLQAEVFLVRHIGQGPLVTQGEVHRLHGPLEQGEQAVGLVDQAAAGKGQQIAHMQVEPLHHRRGGHVAQPLDQGRGIGEVRHQQGSQNGRDDGAVAGVGGTGLGVHRVVWHVGGTIIGCNAAKADGRPRE